MNESKKIPEWLRAPLAATLPSALAVGLTLGLQVPLKASHAPAAATALLIRTASGGLSGRRACSPLAPPRAALM